MRHPNKKIMKRFAKKLYKVWLNHVSCRKEFWHQNPYKNGRMEKVIDVRVDLRNPSETSLVILESGYHLETGYHLPSRWTGNKEIDEG